MKIAYLDCASGISGDMTLAALVDAGADLAAINAGIQTLGLPSVRVEADEVKKKGFRALGITIHHEPEHKHRHLHHITRMIDAAAISPRAKELAARIFTRLGEAEAKVHGTTIEKVHFHEVGAVDSIVDIVGSAIGWDQLGAERIVCSPVPTGSGFVDTEHGRLSIPAPATAELLKGVPLADSNVAAELTTPTGAAIVATLASAFGPPPAMTIERIGCGAGTRELAEQPNLLRLLVGQTADERADEQLWMVETNLDDATGEVVGYVTTRLWEAGALDVTTTAIQMKKNRPGVTVSVLCTAPAVEAVESILFRETTTLGVRRWPISRRRLPREIAWVTTPWGPVDGVVAQVGAGTIRFSPEFESCRQIAETHRVPLQSVYDTAMAAWRAAQ